ncbi:MAG: hypothetical protein RIC16_17295 [Rhodospirillales bacterium]
MTQDQPWTWRGYDAATPPEAFGPLAGVARMWRDRWPDASTFPRWSDFDLMDFKGWWGQVSLAEVEDPFDILFTLWGTRLTDWWELDYTRKRMSEIDKFTGIWESHERGYFRAMVGRPFIGFVTGSLAVYDRSFMYVRGIDLPLCKDGKVGQVMTVFQTYAADDVFVPDAPAIYSDSSG